MGRGLSRQEILQEAIELILAREGEPQTWTAVGRQNGGESGDVEDRKEDNSPSDILKDRELVFRLGTHLKAVELTQVEESFSCDDCWLGKERLMRKQGGMC